MVRRLHNPRIWLTTVMSNRRVLASKHTYTFVALSRAESNIELIRTCIFAIWHWIQPPRNGVDIPYPCACILKSMWLFVYFRRSFCLTVVCYFCAAPYSIVVSDGLYVIICLSISTRHRTKTLLNRFFSLHTLRWRSTWGENMTDIQIDAHTFLYVLHFGIKS